MMSTAAPNALHAGRSLQTPRSTAYVPVKVVLGASPARRTLGEPPIQRGNTALMAPSPAQASRVMPTATAGGAAAAPAASPLSTWGCAGMPLAMPRVLMASPLATPRVVPMGGLVSVGGCGSPLSARPILSNVPRGSGDASSASVVGVGGTTPAAWQWQQAQPQLQQPRPFQQPQQLQQQQQQQQQQQRQQHPKILPPSEMRTSLAPVLGSSPAVASSAVPLEVRTYVVPTRPGTPVRIGTPVRTGTPVMTGTVVATGPTAGSFGGGGGGASPSSSPRVLSRVSDAAASAPSLRAPQPSAVTAQASAFDMIDRNHDGTISRAEFQQLQQLQQVIPGAPSATTSTVHSAFLPTQSWSRPSSMPGAQVASGVVQMLHRSATSPRLPPGSGFGGGGGSLPGGICAGAGGAPAGAAAEGAISRQVARAGSLTPVGGTMTVDGNAPATAAAAPGTAVSSKGGGGQPAMSPEEEVLFMRETVHRAGRRLGRPSSEVQQIASLLEERGILTKEGLVEFALRGRVDEKSAREMQIPLRFVQALHEELGFADDAASGSPTARGSDRWGLGGSGRGMDGALATGCSVLVAGPGLAVRSASQASRLGGLSEVQPTPRSQSLVTVESSAAYGTVKAVNSVERHLQRQRAARVQKVQDVHAMRISNSRSDHWDDPWRDTSSFARCKGAYFSQAGVRPASPRGKSPTTSSGEVPRTSPSRSRTSTSPLRKEAPQVGTKNTRLSGNILTKYTPAGGSMRLRPGSSHGGSVAGSAAVTTPMGLADVTTPMAGTGAILHVPEVETLSNQEEEDEDEEDEEGKMLELPSMVAIISAASYAAAASLSASDDDGGEGNGDGVAAAAAACLDESASETEEESELDCHDTLLSLTSPKSSVGAASPGRGRLEQEDIESEAAEEASAQAQAELAQVESELGHGPCDAHAPMGVPAGTRLMGAEDAALAG